MLEAVGGWWIFGHGHLSDKYEILVSVRGRPKA